jgi:phenylacetate-CoA ligase
MKKSMINHAVGVLKRYLFYLTSQKWDRERIDAYQDAQLIKIVRHAANRVPYYRNLFKEVGFDPDTFGGRQDMYKIPLLTKEDLRTHKDEFISEDAEKYGVHWDSTSGSTGTPLHFVVDNSTKAHKLACVLRSYQWAGYLPGKKTFSIQSYTFNNAESFFKNYKFVNLWRFDAKKLTKHTGLELIKQINQIGPKVFIGYPFSIFMLTQFADREGIPIEPIESIVAAGETLSQRRRELLEAAYGCKVFDFYSHHENVVIITECKHGSKHLCEDFAYNEIVDEAGKDASEKGMGEIVGTGFYNYAMPLIRYRIGDTVMIDHENQDCGCGRKFKIINQIIGRQNDFIETPDGRYIGNVLEHAVDDAQGIMLSQCVQEAVDRMYVNMIIDNTFSEGSTVAFENGLRKRIGDDIRIEFKVVSELERNKSGKTPFIISRIGHNYL